ncbi:hypothetical protein HLH34_10755 [Gluconacetobacter azotocaptans]|uniref:Uncharacterized protein n=1 Tax=Gluconacetobacter azotocaptans TaxID=142834 RepID=A0A7W4JT72_9PROT|nr:hypothetical protein [Gluconacetobacter azotocaptans]MBB2190435.1 hypothetical protein [Gluconacetobacter azotocaptans]MBM9400528.1 hypothetical protein [Gluconacetobacter azotocaptans]GBQ30218.1 hypothetical protein AA13594_1658 [Gluconacetobacter azotocaptans DSM 13594]
MSKASCAMAAERAGVCRLSADAALPGRPRGPGLLFRPVPFSRLLGAGRRAIGAGGVFLSRGGMPGPAVARRA